MGDYHFGVEIEVLVEPHRIRNPLTSLYALYYGKLAASLRVRGLKAKSDDLESGYSKRPEHYNKWWITRDGSLTPRSNQIPIEAVSPVLALRANWEHEIDIFWTAMSAVFHMPARSPQCGSHIHVSKGSNKAFKLSELKTIAYGIVLYEQLVLQLVMANRANNQYCKANTVNSSQLRQHNGNYLAIAHLINNAGSKTALRNIMQNNRYVLWNFDNILPGKAGTVEFRGGRCLRGKVRTKRWIAFTIAFIHAILSMNDLAHPDRTYLSEFTAQSLYAKVKEVSSQLALRQWLPDSYRVLNESQH